MSTDSTQKDYVERTNTAIDYIMQNLDGDLKLENVSQVACFSPFHFHRVFRSLTGETLNEFVRRQRLERALYLMSHSPGKSLTEISLECGFGSSSDFSRSFKGRYGKSPSTFDVNQFRATRRKEFESMIASQANGPTLTRLSVAENPDNFEVVMRTLPARTVAYIRVFDPYQSNEVSDACKRLIRWAEERNVADGTWLGYMWEDPNIVELKNCRYDVAVVVDEGQVDFHSEGEVGRFEFPAMQVADVSISGDIHLEQRALDWLFGTWLPRSGYIPDDQPAFESWDGLPFEHGYEHFELSCQLPVKRM